jgi:hypothetical protein
VPVGVSRKTPALTSVICGLLGGLAFALPAAALSAGWRAALRPAGPAAEILLPPAAAGALHSGEIVELRWRGVPREAEEMELLLSLDGGRSFAVRVTPDLDGDRGAFSWRVPPFPSVQARLAMRINLAGREVIAALSAPFRIAADRRAAPWTARSRGGDLWLGGPDGDAAGEIGRELAAGAPRPRVSLPWPGLIPVAPGSPRPARSRAASESVRYAAAGGLTARALALLLPARLPMALPLRI